jgi:hypothetical protein
VIDFSSARSIRRQAAICLTPTANPTAALISRNIVTINFIDKTHFVGMVLAGAGPLLLAESTGKTS